MASTDASLLLQNTAATLSVEIDLDGVATDPSPISATVQVVRADGTDLVAAGAAAVHGTTGVFQYTLSPTLTATLGTGHVIWTITLNSVVQTLTTWYSIVGGYHFTVAMARQRSPFNDTNTWTVDRIKELRVGVERDIELACGTAFVPRYDLETHPLTRRHLRLNWRNIRKIKSVSVDGQAWSSTDVSSIVNPNNIWLGLGSVATIGYEHGLDYPPRAIADASLRWAQVQADAMAVNGIDPRAVRIDTPDGSMYLAQGLVGGSMFGVPAIDMAVGRYQEPAL